MNQGCNCKHLVEQTLELPRCIHAVCTIASGHTASGHTELSGVGIKYKNVHHIATSS